MRVKVGDAYIEVEYDVDDAGAIGRIKAFQRTAEALIGDLKVKVDVDHNRFKTALTKLFTSNDRDVDVHSQRWGHTVGRNMIRGIDAAISMLPGRMESLFSGRGGPIGLALGAAIIAGVGGALPAVAAMISGALFAAFGSGAVATGIIMAADDPKVKAAAGRLKDLFVTQIWNGEAAQRYAAEVVPALDKVTHALERWAPLINSMLVGSARFLGPLTDGLIGFIDGFMKPMEKMMNSPFMTSIMEALGKGLTTLGQAVGDIFTRFMSNADAMTGATMGLEDLFNALASAIRFTTDVLVFFSAIWGRWNTVGADGATVIDHIRDVLGAVGSAIKTAAEVLWGILVPAFKILWILLKPLVLALKDLALWLGGALVVAGRALGHVLEEIAGWLEKHERFARILSTAIKLLVEGLIAYKIVMIAVRVATLIWAAAQFVLDAALAPVVLVIIAVVAAIALLVLAIIWVVKHTQWFKDRWNEVWGWVKAHAEAWWHNFLAFVQGWMQNIINWWNNSLNFIKNIWNTVWGAIKDFIVGWWEMLFNIFTTAMNAIYNFLKPALDVIVNIFKVPFQVIVALVLIAFELISRGIDLAMRVISNIIKTDLEFIKGLWNDAWGWVKDKAEAIWNGIWGTIQFFLNIIKEIINTDLEFIKNIWNVAWGAVKDKASAVWNDIWGVVQFFFNLIKDVINTDLEFVKSIWNAAWEVVKEKASFVWNFMWGMVQYYLNLIKDFIDATMRVISNTWNTIWEGIKNVLGGIWSGIVNAVKGGINSVIDILNKGIDAINSVLDKLGISFRISKIGSVSVTSAPNMGNTGGAFSRLAGGGKVKGPGTPTSDSVPIWASRDEFMIRAKAAQRIGYRNLAYMNKTGQFPANYRFAGGGRVGAGNNSLLEAHRNHVHVAMSGPLMSYPQIITAAGRSGLPFTVGSTYRPGSRAENGNLDHHSEGRAVDFPGYNQDAFAGYWEHVAGVIELIHRTNSRDYAIFGGKGGISLPGFLANGIGWIMDHMLNPPVNALINAIPGGQVYGEVAKASVAKMRDGLKQKIQDFINSFAAADSGGGNISGGAARWRDTGLLALQMLGLPSSWINPLLTLISRESGGNPSAVNRWDSNAARGTPSMGLMQTIGPTFSAYHLAGYNNILAPLDNILAGLRYIVSRYGSIFNVQQAVGSTPRGYKNGGWMSPGWNLVHEPELALNSAQGKALEDRIRGGGHGYEMHFHFHGITKITPAEAKKIAEQVRDEFVKLGGRNGGRIGLPGSS